ncbi:RNA polymerase sigma factor [Corynebacterium parakroppenstedtii]|uniref:RNA polymerase sigma factor n=1 Tax=Corynebacterium parakroppenstedtii TaxID=2828363 RepID=UPI001C8FA139|nr:RNA polymerase sigma factor [Corynebacterium parakroppenstedtii]MBY0794270.1 RNA polymerase sigma factor [Corynebacterium parakroppenstedtii]
MVLIGGRARISSGDGPLPNQSQNTVALGDADGSRSEDRYVADTHHAADTHAANTHADDGPDRGYDSRRTRPRELEAMSDRELFAAVSAGQADAMAVLAHRHEKSIRFAISRWVDCPEDVDDLWQDTLFKAQRAATMFRGRCAPGTWLHRIAVNTAKDYLRRRGNARMVVLDDATLPAEFFHANEGGLRAALKTALAGLDEPFRTTFLLVDLYGFSVKETAAKLDISPGTVKSRCSRARQTLRSALSEEL